MHHTVTADDDPDPAATLRAIYDDHVHNPARDFGDIGYHVLIDAAGTLYEGRNGENSSPLFGHRFVDGRWEMVRAAHVALNNTGNFGIALLGDLTSVQPTPLARRALVGVLAVPCLVHGLDPLSVVHYVNSAGERDIDALAMHRQGLATECPGESFAPVFGAVRTEVARVLRTVGARDTLLAGLPADSGPRPSAPADPAGSARLARPVRPALQFRPVRPVRQSGPVRPALQSRPVRPARQSGPVWQPRSPGRSGQPGSPGWPGRPGGFRPCRG